MTLRERWARLAVEATPVSADLGTDMTWEGLNGHQRDVWCFIADALLADVRARVPHWEREGRHAYLVDKHLTDEAMKECAELGGRCAWEGDNE